MDSSDDVPRHDTMLQLLLEGHVDEGGATVNTGSSFHTVYGLRNIPALGLRHASLMVQSPWSVSLTELPLNKHVSQPYTFDSDDVYLFTLTPDESCIYLLCKPRSRR